MKKFVLAITALLTFTSLILASCTADSDNSLVDSYKADAQEYIDEGDIDSAIKTLRKGVEKTGDKSLEDLLDMLEAVSGNKSGEDNIEKPVKEESSIYEDKDAKPEIENTEPRVEEKNQDAEEESEDTGDYSSYSGDWSYYGWSEEASFSLDIKGNTLDMSGIYSFNNYISDDPESVTDANFSASARIVDGTALVSSTDSYGTPFTIQLTFKERKMTDKVIGYILADCLYYDNKHLSTIVGNGSSPENFTATFYDSKNGYILETIETIENHCENGYSTGYFSDGGSYTQGGNFVNFALDGNELTVHYTSISSAPFNRIAEIEETVDLTYAIIDKNTVRIPFHEAGWGNSGVLTVKFNPGNGGPMVNCSLSEMVYASDALWYPVTSDGVYQMYDPDVEEPEYEWSEEERQVFDEYINTLTQHVQQ